MSVQNPYGQEVLALAGTKRPIQNQGVNSLLELITKPPPDNTYLPPIIPVSFNTKDFEPGPPPFDRGASWKLS
jgi:hypothetical protein